MSLDPYVQRFLQRLSVAAPRAIGSLTVAERRATLARLLSFAGEAPAAGRCEEREAPGPNGAVRLRIYTPIHAVDAALPGMIYFHGGGMVAGSLETHAPIARSLADATGCRVVSVDYRLAPEARFPAALQDACAAVHWVVRGSAQLGIDPARLGVCGDSAGAALTAAVCQIRAAAGDGGIAFQVLLCPILDYRAAADGRRAYSGADLLDRETLEHDLEHYLGPDCDPADPRISPLAAPSVAGLPPASIHTAEHDPLREDGELYAHRLGEAGVRTLYHCHPGMIHLFYGLGAVIPYAAQAYRRIGADTRALLD